MIRVAHFSDVHWQVAPAWSDLLNKRLLGSANLYLRGRAAEFDERAQAALVASVVEAQPTAVVITGDLTAQALPAEFEKARAALAPLLDRVPTLVQNGNHDVYVGEAQRGHFLAKSFGSWMHGGDVGLARLDVGSLTVLGLDPNRATTIDASGEVPPAQLDALKAALDGDDLDGRSVLLALHYPVVGPSSSPYDGWYHGLRNARALIDVLANARHAPVAVLHGHKHHAYHATIAAGSRAIPQYDPGSGGWAFDPAHGRAAAYNVYTLDGGSVSAQRFVWDGATFAPERTADIAGARAAG